MSQLFLKKGQIVPYFLSPPHHYWWVLLLAKSLLASRPPTSSDWGQVQWPMMGVGVQGWCKDAVCSLGWSISAVPAACRLSAGRALPPDPFPAISGCALQWLVSAGRHQAAASSALPTHQPFTCSPSCCPLPALPLRPTQSRCSSISLPVGRIPLPALCGEPATGQNTCRLHSSPRDMGLASSSHPSSGSCLQGVWDCSIP